MNNAVLVFLTIMALTPEQSDKWSSIDYVIDNFELVYTIDLEMTNDASIIGNINQILFINNELFIVDGVSTATIKRFSMKGKFLGLFSRKGQGPGEYQTPWKLVCDSKSNIFLYDLMSTQIKMFNGEYKYIRSFSITTPGRKRTIFPRDMDLYQDRLFIHLLPDEEKVRLLEVKASGPEAGKVINLVLHADERPIPRSPKFEVTFVGDRIWLSKDSQAAVQIFDANKLLEPPVNLRILGYPNMLDEAKFNFEKNTYDGISLTKLWYRGVNRVSLLANIDDRFAMVGFFLLDFPDGPAEEPTDEVSAHAIRKEREKYNPHVNIYSKEGVLLRKQLPIRPFDWPLKPGYALASHDSRHLFFYAWREETEQNPIIQVYRYKGGS